MRTKIMVSLAYNLLVVVTANQNVFTLVPLVRIITSALKNVVVTSVTPGSLVLLVNSEKTGIMYDKKHLSCDFNTGKRFVEQIRDKFGKTIQFEEVYLDYVYMPGGVSRMNLEE